MQKNKGSVFIFLIIIVSAILVWVGFSSLGKPEVPEYSSQKSGDAWDVYENKEIGIRLEYPPNWRVFESDEDGLPVVNFYPGNEIESAIGIFDNRTHLSIYPKGVKDLNVIGESFETNFGATFASVDTEYSLKDGDWWARSLKPTSAPADSWGEMGFVWVGRLVDDQSFECFRDEEQVEVDECNTVDGDVFYRLGTPSKVYDETLSKMLSSIEISN